jgi:hypothetical protein
MRLSHQKEILGDIIRIRRYNNKLPNGKAPGHHGVFYEHIKLGQHILLMYLVQLFNSIIKVEYIHHLLS